jgi:transposase
LNETVDEVRRQEQRGRPGLKNTRFLWLRKGDSLSASAKLRVVELSKEFPRTGLAYRLKESFMLLWGQSQERAEAFLRGWQSWAVRAKLPPFREFCEMVKGHWKGMDENARCHPGSRLLSCHEAPGAQVRRSA